jgi:hypothetical protein
VVFFPKEIFPSFASSRKAKEMGPKKVQISQEAFNAVVKENVEEFDMELAEALEDAIKTFQMQGADLSGSNSLLHNKHLSFFIFSFPLMHSASDDDHNIAQHCKGIAELLCVKKIAGFSSVVWTLGVPGFCDQGKSVLLHMYVHAGIITDGSESGDNHPSVHAVKELNDALTLLCSERGGDLKPYSNLQAGTCIPHLFIFWVS